MAKRMCVTQEFHLMQRSDYAYNDLSRFNYVTNLGSASSRTVEGCGLSSSGFTGVCSARCAFFVDFPDFAVKKPNGSKNPNSATIFRIIIPLQHKTIYDKQ